MRKHFIEWWVTWFGLGRLPKFPGTWGTLGAIPLVWVFAHWHPLAYMGLTLALIAISIPLIDLYQRKTQKHDSQEIVVDEVAGYLVTMTWLPLTWQSFAAGFVLFRILDIWKPLLIRRLDQSAKGGMGVLADDLAAGVLGNVLLQLVLVKTTWLG